MLVHVICCNDSIEYAVINDENKALSKLDELRNVDYEKEARFFETLEEYRTQHYWYLHTINGE